MSIKDLKQDLEAEVGVILGMDFEVEVTATGVKGCAWGERIDPARHVLAHEVKAITYHGLRVEREGDGWVAEVIVDI